MRKIHLFFTKKYYFIFNMDLTVDQSSYNFYNFSFQFFMITPIVTFDCSDLKSLNIKKKQFYTHFFVYIIIYALNFLFTVKRFDEN